MAHTGRYALVGLALAGMVMVGLPMMAVSGVMGGGTAQQSCAAGGATVALPSGEVVVGASDYGGPGDPTTPGDSGAYGPLSGHYAFAELSTNWAAPSGWNFSALGGMAPYSLLQITYNGRSVIAEKLDVGRGGPPVGSPPTPRAIDLWWQTASALGFSGTGLVAISVAPPGTPASAALDPNAASAVVATGSSGSASGSSGSGGDCVQLASFASSSSIVSIANSQVGTAESPDGSNCTPYGPCEEWCALFASWVWSHAGVPVPSLASTAELYAWAEAHTSVLPATAVPSPGDLVFFGPGASLHVGVVTQVLADGDIVEVDGNYANQVSRVGPYNPAQAPTIEAGTIFGYAQPAA